MEITVFVEPIGSRFRASTGNPIALSAEGASEDAALSALRDQLSARQRSGGHFRTMAVTDSNSVLAAARTVGENPLFEEWVRAVDAYRASNNAVPDPD